jgi:hypothetical protein
MDPPPASLVFSIPLEDLLLLVLKFLTFLKEAELAPLRNLILHSLSFLYSKELKKFDLNAKWEATSEAKKFAVRAKRAALTDLDRFKVMISRKNRSFKLR